MVAKVLPKAVFDAFREASMSVELSDWLPGDEAPGDLAVAAASNDLATIGCLLGRET
jgi:hypothetical protein